MAVEAVGRVGDEVESASTPSGWRSRTAATMSPCAVEHLGHAEAAQVVLVFGESRGDDGGAGVDGELDGEAADAAGRAHDQQAVAFGELERVDRRERGDAGQRGCTGRGALEAGGLACDGVSSGTAISSAQVPSCTAGLAWTMKPYTSSPAA